MEYVKLNNGLEMPVLGLGTYLLKPEDAENAVITALKNGYELIDTANAYVNERAVGRGIKKSGVRREDVFLETKLWPSLYEEEDAVDKTLERLGTPYIDLMILHQPAGNFIAGYRLLEKAYKEGKLKAIGISNFNQKELEYLYENCEITPALIQVETHPYYPQDELNLLLKKYGTALQAWYPLGGRDNKSILEENIVKSLAGKYKKSPAQIILRWHTQKGYIVIPGSKSEGHIKENLNVFDFKLTDEDMQEMAKLDRHDSIFHRTDELLKQFAAWRPEFEKE